MSGILGDGGLMYKRWVHFFPHFKLVFINEECVVRMSDFRPNIHTVLADC